MNPALTVFAVGMALTAMTTAYFLRRTLVSQDDMFETGFHLNLTVLSLFIGTGLSLLLSFAVILGASQVCSK